MKKIRHLLFNNEKGPKYNRKLVGILLLVVTLGLFFLFVVRLTRIVVTDKVAGVKLSQQIKNLYNGSSTIVATRGTIYDRSGNAIAEDATSYSVYAILDEDYIGIGKEKLYAQKKDFDTIAQVLVDTIGVEKEYVLTQLNSKTDEGKTPFQVEFGKKGKTINLETKLKIEDALKMAKVKGIYFTNHPARLYPNGDFASYLVGYAQLDDPKDETLGLKGIMGIESVYNDELTGKDGTVVYEKDHNGNPVPGTVQTKNSAENGEDIYTTIDSNLQSYLETLMDKMITYVKPENLTAVMVKAKTGEIVAMSQRPSFNPQKGFAEDTLYRNLVVQDAFEPGSTMKSILLSAAINEGTFQPNETYNPALGVKIYDTVINDHDFGAQGTLNMSQAFSWSSNVGMVKTEQELGDKNWLDYLGRFGFGKSTDSGLPEETAGSLPGNNPVDIAMSAYGQAVSVSGLQMIQAYTAIANGGQMLKPYYVSKTVNSVTGKITPTTPTELGQVITPETASSVLEHMRTVVEDQNYGTGTPYAIKGYKVGAKTGTAQFAEKGAYAKGATDYIYSVMMVAPADDPEYLLYATIKRPEKWTNATLSALTNPLMKRALDMKETEVAQTAMTVGNYASMSVTDAKEKIEADGLTAVVVGNGDEVVSQSVPIGTSLLANAKVMLLTNGEKTMPDTTGWSKNDVLSLEKLVNVEFIVEGQGYVTAQSLAAGKEITDEEIRIVLNNN